MNDLWFNPRFMAVAITGADVAGKSTGMKAIWNEVSEHGIRLAVSSEGASEVIGAGFPPVGVYRDGNDVFQRYLYDYIKYKEEMYCRMLFELDTDAPLVLLCDRGVLDNIAYMGREKFSSLAMSRQDHIHTLRERYKAVIHLVTAADGAEEAYLAAVHNNPNRIIRSIEEARELDRLTREAWHGHPHQIIIDNSTDFPTKMKRVVQALRRILPMPVAIEQERKFVVLSGEVPNGAEEVAILQTYLKSDDPKVERRVRSKTVGDATTYWYTEKRPTADSDKREEVDDPIFEPEYQEKLKERDSATQTITKMRRSYTYRGRCFEDDLYITIIPGVRILEIENCPLDAVIEFPPGYQVKEVTGDKRFSNKRIAEGKFPLEEVRSTVA